jgi:hypothetical protein
MPTVKAILGDRVAPGMLDRYLASMGYESQQTSEPEDPNRPDNLFNPVPGDHGAHGTFDDQASAHSAQLWASTHRGPITLGALLAAGAALAMGLLASSSEDGDDWRKSPGPGPRERAELRALIDTEV